MPGFKFNRAPISVPKVSTKYRSIQTKIPVPDSIRILEDLDKYESRSMHGQMPVIWSRAEGCTVSDLWGNRWIDFTSTIFLANAGHSHPHIIEALQGMLGQKLLHTYSFPSAIRSRFLKRLIAITPASLEKAYLVSAGTEATECALKLMRMYGQTRHPKRSGVISFKESMYGRTMAAEMLQGNPDSTAWIGYMDPNIYHMTFPTPWTVTQPEICDWSQKFRTDIGELAESNVITENICGFILESYLGWGALFFPKVYMQELVSFARQHDILVTFDEIQGGFGRTGKLFAYEHYDVEPDLVCVGKGISSSLPLAGVIGRREILDLPEAGSMSSTHSANPLSCAAGLANLEVIEKENLVAESARKGELLHKKLNALQLRFPHRIRYVFGKGLLAAIITQDPMTGKPDALFASCVCERAEQKGLLLVHTGRESIKIGPPLTVPEEALLEGLEVLEEALGEVDEETKGRQ